MAIDRLCLTPPLPPGRSTVPFVAKAVGHPIAKYASLLMAGRTLKASGWPVLGGENVDCAQAAASMRLLPTTGHCGTSQPLPFA